MKLFKVELIRESEEDRLSEEEIFIVAEDIIGATESVQCLIATKYEGRVVGSIEMIARETYFQEGVLR